MPASRILKFQEITNIISRTLLLLSILIWQQSCTPVYYLESEKIVDQPLNDTAKLLKKSELYSLLSNCPESDTIFQSAMKKHKQYNSLGNAALLLSTIGIAANYLISQSNIVSVVCIGAAAAITFILPLKYGLSVDELNRAILKYNTTIKDSKSK